MQDKITLSERLTQLRESKGYTMKEVAEGIGMKPDSYRNYERGRLQPSIETIIKISKFYGITTDCLLGLNAPAQPATPLDEFVTSEHLHEVEEALLRMYFKLDRKERAAFMQQVYDEVQKKHTENATKIAVHWFKKHSNQASAGNGYDLENADLWESVKIYDHPAINEADFLVKVDGDSMKPTYYNGDLVFVKLDSDVPEGQAGLFTKAGKGYIKRAGKNRLLSDNPDYPDVYPEGEEIKCIGRIIGVATLAKA